MPGIYQQDWEDVARDVAQAITYNGKSLGPTSDEVAGISVFWTLGSVEERVGEAGITALFPRKAGLACSATIVLAARGQNQIDAAFGELSQGGSVDLSLEKWVSGERIPLHSFEFVGLRRTLTGSKVWLRTANQAWRHALFEANTTPVMLTFYPGDDGSLAKWTPRTSGSNEAGGIAV